MLRTALSALACIACLATDPALAGQSWHTKDTYPPEALREHREGTTYFSVTVGTNGKAKNCVVTRSSGSADLDEAACAIILRRGRWHSATDAKGTPIEGIFASKFVWSIPD